MKKLNVLFICSRNQWRSPTAEQVWRKHPKLNTRSAGTSQSAKKVVSIADIEWADVIFAMESKHKSKLLQEFRGEIAGKSLHVLDIPDEYKYMDPELVDEIQRSVGDMLQLD